MEELLQKYKLQIGTLLTGLILIGVGVLGFKYFSLESGSEIEILEGSDFAEVAADKVKIVVDISGEVIKPGVYELESGSRINDLLITAGGLSAKADREWVSKNINLAQKLTDGVKIYIPEKTEKLPNLSNLTNPSNSSKININNASLAELDTLWGVGEATAKKIIEGRPYQKPEELLEKKIVKSNVWESIKDQVTVY